MGEQSKVVDSAIVIAIVSGFCYFVGYLVRVQDAARLRIPFDFLPKASVEETILYGFLTILVFLIGVLLVSALVILIFKLLEKFRLLPMKAEARLSSYLQKSFNANKGIYTGIGLLILFVSAWTIAMNPLVPLNSYERGMLPKVVDLRLKGSTNAIIAELEYFARKEGVVILRCPTNSTFMLIEEDTLESLVLDSRARMPALKRRKS